MHIPVSKIKHQERGVDVPLLIWLYGKEERKKQIWKWRGKEINKEIDNYMTNLLNSIEKIYDYSYYTQKRYISERCHWNMPNSFR